MAVKILEREREWTKIQTPDEYVHWVLSGSLQRVDEAGLHAWNRASQVVVTALHGFVYQEKSTRSQTVSDVVAGDRLRLIARRGKFYEVLYPDGRRGFISRKISQPIWEWRSKLKRNAQSILKTAYSLNGVPYMWLGTSPKGMDCSGFVRTTLYCSSLVTNVLGALVMLVSMLGRSGSSTHWDGFMKAVFHQRTPTTMNMISTVYFSLLACYLILIERRGSVLPTKTNITNDKPTRFSPHITFGISRHFLDSILWTGSSHDESKRREEANETDLLSL